MGNLHDCFCSQPERTYASFRKQLAQQRSYKTKSTSEISKYSLGSVHQQESFAAYLSSVMVENTNQLSKQELDEYEQHLDHFIRLKKLVNRPTLLQPTLTNSTIFTNRRNKGYLQHPL